MANNLIRLWDTDPDSKPRERTRFADDIVGRFRSGRLVGKMPEALNEWRVTTGDPEVADKIAALMGGSAAEWETDKEDNLEILTDAPSVRIVIDSSADIDASMKKFGFQGLEHHCDGVQILSPEEEKGDLCGCPESLQDRKDRARSGKGPKPSIDVTFRLAADPELGKFRFNSGSWSLVNVLHDVFAAVDAYDGRPVLASLTIEHVAYTTKTGRDVAFNMPVIKVLGAAEAAQPADLPMAA
ncbi:recombination directionality factor [Streptomyces tsukubensis]|uniref:recombination directionality factor n=1 Tax=Streptomyces tsukubensis TaxID=83656 RepID=UPI00344C9286